MFPLKKVYMFPLKRTLGFIRPPYFILSSLSLQLLEGFFRGT